MWYNWEEGAGSQLLLFLWVGQQRKWWPSLYCLCLLHWRWGLVRATRHSSLIQWGAYLSWPIHNHTGGSLCCMKTSDSSRFQCPIAHLGLSHHPHHAHQRLEVLLTQLPPARFKIVSKKAAVGWPGLPCFNFSGFICINRFFFLKQFFHLCYLFLLWHNNPHDITVSTTKLISLRVAPPRHDYMTCGFKGRMCRSAWHV